jgi:putative SOS response-associated peptidase YedK
MCNLYRLDAPAAQIARLFGADQGGDPWPGGYVSPGRPAPVIVRNAKGERRMVPRIWGVPPPPRGDRPVTNVRNLDSPFWIGTLRHTEFRCLIPVTRFQEWGGEKGNRTQHWFSVPSEPVFALAGIWRDSEIATFAMLTTEPNTLVGAVHPKAMPVILHPEDHDIWLRADWPDARRVVDTYPSQLMLMETQAASAKSP